MNELNIRNLRLADFAYAFNKSCQRFSDVILQEGSGVAVIPTLAKKITSELAEVMARMLAWPAYLLITLPLAYCNVGLVSACLDQETDKYPLRGLLNIRKLTYSIDPFVLWSEPL